MYTSSPVLNSLALLSVKEGGSKNINGLGGGAFGKMLRHPGALHRKKFLSFIRW